MGVKGTQKDVSKENGDPEKGDSDKSNKEINEAYDSILKEIVNPNLSGSHKPIMDSKRLNIIKAIKEVCKSCCCNRTEEQYCIKPSDVSKAVKQVCAQCCCKSDEPCVKYEEIMKHVNKLCENCHCKDTSRSSEFEKVIKDIEKFCSCPVSKIRSHVEGQQSTGCSEQCSTCQTGGCYNYATMMDQIDKRCPGDDISSGIQKAIQACSKCHVSEGSQDGCDCCKKVAEALGNCDCVPCKVKGELEGLNNNQGSSAKCCDQSGCCNGDEKNCLKKDVVEQKLNGLCNCKTQLDNIQKDINAIKKKCNEKTCCNVKTIENEITQICNSCPCKQMKCCDEDKIKQKVKDVIEQHCKCRLNKCCFRDITEKTLTEEKYKTEQEKLKKIGREILKYFRPPALHTTGILSFSSDETEINFCTSSSSSNQTDICVEEGFLKIPQQAFNKIKPSTRSPGNKIGMFYVNSMASIVFEEICLTFQKLNGSGFKIDGFPINGTFLMQLGYNSAGPFTRNTANWRKKNSDGKHDLSWDIYSSHPQLIAEKCSCSILSDPLFGTVFGTICLTISIVQFIIALSVSQGYYDGFQSYMDAVRSGFSWPTQYDNVVSSMFWWFGLGVRNGSRLLLGLYKTDILVVVC
ncbi:uncharacterized protein BdWA1_004063 [Babesia duncani]|uniref:Uncharacterized protein n=1 Tax=Babesia duncani TaxID=323732 RepID=A0AAD9UM40_9APIC|nr:hypothetical protein BdWA1_004063 [Babesia duncani]